jgi:hypothetical protein
MSQVSYTFLLINSVCLVYGTRWAGSVKSIV